MKAVLLHQLGEGVATLPGVGPAAARRLAALGAATVGALLEHFPRAYEDRRRITPLAALVEGRPAVVRARVAAHHWFGPRARHLRIALAEAAPPDPGPDAADRPPPRRAGAHRHGRSAAPVAGAALLCFGRRYLARSLPVGAPVTVAAAFHRRAGAWQAASFELLRAGDAANSGRIVPIYPLTEGIRPAMLRRATLAACAALAGVATPWDGYCLRRGLLPVAAAVRALHFPAHGGDIDRARAAVAYAELLQLQHALRRRRQPRRAARGVGGALPARIVARLRFAPTRGQQAALRAIGGGLSAAGPCARLLQGEVGCGKTLVALLAAAWVVEAREQVAFIVPTELLARQHLNSACRMLAPERITVALLTGVGAARGGHAVPAGIEAPPDGVQALPGGMQALPRAELLADLRRGAIDVLFGTHALLQDEVVFARLGLVVIDEQHRFGVLQRRHLLQRAPRADLLLMTATPIPRSLAMTVYGDLARTAIRELPPGRLPVRTHLVRLANVGRVHARVRTELAAGGQVYVVAPRIGAPAPPEAPAPGADPDAGVAPAPPPAAESLFAELRDEVYPEFRCGLIHGAMNELDKHAVMEAFRRGALSILVATTVVEVGVDVTGATGIVVFGAERFGLATLHQLRGRVGRGARQGYAYLVYGEPLSAAGAERLRAMKACSDGFEIAERDLGLRGPGQLLGLRQAGLPELRVAELPRDLPLALEARAAIARTAPAGAPACA